MSALPQTPSRAAVRRAVRRLRPPANLFSGVTWQSGTAPDNVVIFRRRHTRAFRPEGVSHNYHHRFELVIVIDRPGLVRIGDAGFLLQPGEAALIFPHQFHHYMDVREGALEWLFITFELLRAKPLEPLRDAPRVLAAKDWTTLRHVLAAATPARNAPPEVAALSYYLGRLLRDLGRRRAIPAKRRNVRTGDPARDTVLERINRIVRSRLADAPSLAELAKAAGYSASHLRMVFRTSLGISLGRYIRESRLSAAAVLLQSTFLPVSEVARRTGFASLFAFSRSFKSAYGVPPMSYRKQSRQPP